MLSLLVLVTGSVRWPFPCLDCHVHKKPTVPPDCARCPAERTGLSLLSEPRFRDLPDEVDLRDPLLAVHRQFVLELKSADPDMHASLDVDGRMDKNTLLTLYNLSTLCTLYTLHTL